MKKILSGIALTAMFVLPFAASAATISDPLFSNGDTTIDAQGGSTVNGTFTLQVGPSEVCEVLRTQAAPQAFTDTSVGNSLGYQQGTFTGVPFNVKVSPNTGTYYPTVQCAGIYGGNRSVDGADNVVTGSVSLGTIRVVASGSTTSGSSSDVPSWFAQFLAFFMASSTTATPPAPVITPACAAYAQANVGTQYGVRNSANIALQGFLLSQHMSIPALAAGASFGFDGPQTESARASFLSTAHCN